MAQAQGPAEAQVQQPAHPIHEEAATHAALTKIVSESTDNDPHVGTDLEESAPAKEAEKPESEAKAEESETPEIELDEDAPIFEMPDMEDKSKSVKVSLKQLREERMMKADYMRNIQRVKAEEASLQEKVRAETLKAQQEYVQRLEVHKQAVTKLAGVKTMPEIEELSRSDPAAAQQEFLRMISVNQTLQSIEGEQRQAQQKLQAEQQAAMQAAIQKSRQQLETDIPGWGEELYKNVLGSVAKDYGFKNEEVAPVVDARLIKVFHDAYQYRQLQRAKPEISKKVVAVPKVVKPGSAQSQNTSSTAAQEAEQRLKKTGRGEDFVAWYMAQQKQQKRK